MSPFTHYSHVFIAVLAVVAMILAGSSDHETDSDCDPTIASSYTSVTFCKSLVITHLHVLTLSVQLSAAKIKNPFSA